METTTTAVAESSPAPSTAFAPTGESRNEWLRTGKTEAAPKPETSATSAETSAAGDKTPKENSAPASEAGKNQEQKTRSNADTRLNELLDDLREAGLTPKALKSFKQDYQRTQQQTETAKAAPEQTAKPVSADPKAPVKPKPEDFEGKPWTDYEAAKDKYFEDLADYKTAKALEGHTARQREEAANREMQEKLSDATKRYGDTARDTITETATTIFNDAKVHDVVKALANDSPAFVDLMYTIGQTPEALKDFLDTAHSNPGLAIRKLVLMEKLVLEELAKGGKAEGETEAPRGEDGKFKSTPEKKTTAAPPPPKEVSGRSAAPPDDVEAAFKSGDARAFIDAENRRDLRKRKGL